MKGNYYDYGKKGKKGITSMILYPSIGDTPIFNFHDYGKKGKKTPPLIRVDPRPKDLWISTALASLGPAL